MSFDLLSTIGADQEMSVIFSEDRAIGDLLQVEAAFAHGLHDAGLIDAACAGRIAAACTPAAIDRDELWAQTVLVGYPVLPLVRMICARVGEPDAGWVHYGATTQDIMDSALAMQLRDAADRLLEMVRRIGDGLAARTEEHAGTVMAGRTHAQQAVPTTFGAKLAVFLSEFTRCHARLRSAREAAATVSMFGAGGTSAALGLHADAVRRTLAHRLGLTHTDVPWHVARDRVAHLCLVAAEVAGTCVRLAREIVDLSRTEVGEVAEADGMYRGASSTMPQKANPISAEITVGFGVMAQAGAQAMLRAMEAGHERSAGEWQVEWQAVPLVFRSAAGALRAASSIVSGLRVFSDRMRGNLDLDGGRIMAEAYMISLAAHVGRERAHEVLYRAVRVSRTENRPLLATLRDSLPAEAWISISADLPRPESYLGSVRSICAAAAGDWQTERGNRRPEFGSR
jgi:3-carboxy-cis,cis-muconate cycloisomerase